MERLPDSDTPVVRATPGFDAFYRAEYRQVVGLAFALSRNRETAEELAQEAFTAAFRRWDEVARMDRPDAWVRRVAANKAMSRFRWMTAEAKAMLRTDRPRECAPLAAEDLAVWEAVRKLPRRQAEVIALAFWGDLTHAQIAQVMGLGVETVRTHLQRARRRLAASLGEEA